MRQPGSRSGRGFRSAILDLKGYSELPTADKTVRTAAQSRQSLLRRDLPSSDRNQPATDSQCDRFGAGGSTKLVKNRADVELDGVFGDTEPRRDIFVDKSLR